MILLNYEIYVGPPLVEDGTLLFLHTNYDYGITLMKAIDTMIFFFNSFYIN